MHEAMGETTLLKFSLGLSFPLCNTSFFTNAHLVFDIMLRNSDDQR